MSKRPDTRGSAAAPLLHWLLVLSGLALLTWLRPDDTDKIAPLWVSTLLATALGQLFARLRLRLWLVAFLVFNGMWMLPLTMVHVLTQMSNPWPAVEIFLLAFGPGTICAYLSMSERGGLLAFWFPAALWMLSILDGSEDTALSGPLSWVLLSALAALLIASLRLQETRRIAVWQAHATVRLAPQRPTVILRRQPLRVAAQLAWVVTLAAATLALTAWIAPSLWHKDPVPGEQASQVAGSPQGSGASGSGEPCCTDSSFAEAPRSRVREYFSMLRPHGDRPPSPPTSCVACSDGVPIEGARAAVASVTTGSGGVVQGDRGSAVVGGPSLAAAPASADPFAPTPPVVAAPPVPVAAKPIVAPPRPRPPVFAARPIVGAGASRPLSGATILVVPGEPSSGVDPFGWLITFALSASIVQLGSRPLRRLLALRHLRRPFWAETVDQRVSNLWQLMLVGLRDAGFRAAPGEQPQELARRVGIEGMGTCATVLERARHGVRVDAADLAEMERAASAVYEAARHRAGWPARAAASLRWPLI